MNKMIILREKIIGFIFIVSAFSYMLLLLKWNPELSQDVWNIKILILLSLSIICVFYAWYMLINSKETKKSLCGGGDEIR